ncbi:MAG: diaminopimelate decarboxylase, partial [Symbiobacteriaceae bacterium]|nr:diaminopimelate decarboxylase [Symbiobacteriaceae bacterium]
MRFHDGIANIEGVLHIGGLSAEELVATYGSPLYVYDEATLRARCREISAVSEDYPGLRVYYASKAFPNTALERLFASEGLGIDVASEGELLTALRAGIPGSEILLHGVVKPRSYLELGIAEDATIVLDSLADMEQVALVALGMNRIARCYLRLNPGVTGDSTHPVTTAGNTKFGISLIDGSVYRAIAAARNMSSVDLIGLHCHVGSQLGNTNIYAVTDKILLSVLQKANETGAALTGINLGGGFGVHYREGQPGTTVNIGSFIREITTQVKKCCAELSLPLPRLSLELGRSLVAEAAVAIYRVAAVKTVPWLKDPLTATSDLAAAILDLTGLPQSGIVHSNYLIIDGGLYDNPRPLLYGAVYDAVLPLRLDEAADTTYTVSGMSCETDTLISEVALPRVSPGEILAIPSSGAYQMAM